VSTDPTTQINVIYEVTSEDVYGCTDAIAINYNPLAECNDGSCNYAYADVVVFYDSTEYNLFYQGFTVDYSNGGDPTGWVVNSVFGGDHPFWFERLLDDTTYQNKLKCRWEYLRERSFSQDSIFNFIDSISFYLDSAQQRNFQRWNLLSPFFQEEIDILKDWLEDRLLWLDSNMPGNCYITNPIE